MILLLIRLALINLARNTEVGGWHLEAAASSRLACYDVPGNEELSQSLTTVLCGCVYMYVHAVCAHTRMHAHCVTVKGQLWVFLCFETGPLSGTCGSPIRVGTN